jgi:hypothetical protein
MAATVIGLVIAFPSDVLGRLRPGRVATEEGGAK